MSGINFTTPEVQKAINDCVLEMCAWNNIPINTPIRLVVEEYYRDRRVSVTTSSITVDEFERHMKRASHQTDCKLVFENLEEENCLAKVIRESKPYPKNYIAYYYDESKKITEMYKEANKIKAII